MLIPLADVPRWFAERKPKDTIAISHGADELTWEQLERNANRRARAFMPKASSPAISSPSASPTVTHFSRPPLRCGNAARRRPR